MQEDLQEQLNRLTKRVDNLTQAMMFQSESIRNTIEAVRALADEFEEKLEQK